MAYFCNTRNKRSNHRNVLHRLFALIFLGTISAGSSIGDVFGNNSEKKAEDKRSSTLVLESADMNENSLVNGEFVSVLKGHVVFAYDSMKIRSSEATWWRSTGVIQFNNNVKVEKKSQTLTCDRMHFDKETNLLNANGHFNFYDSIQKTRLTGSDGDFHFANKVFRLRGNPKMVRVDSAAAETLTIAGLEMTYVDSLKKATVVNKVKITKGQLLSTCQLANYYTNTNIAQLRDKPFVNFEIHQVSGDSIDLHFGKESLKDAIVMGNSHGLYIDTTGSSAVSTKEKTQKNIASVRSTKDTMFTNIWSDSLFMTVSDSGKLDSLYASGKVKSTYYSNKDPSASNEANGKAMVLAFTTKGNLDFIKMWGNARSIYFIDEEGGEGRNEATGDTISVAFNAKGKARRLILAGSARGVYFPQLFASK